MEQTKNLDMQLSLLVAHFSLDKSNGFLTVALVSYKLELQWNLLDMYGGFAFLQLIIRLNGRIWYGFYHFEQFSTCKMDCKCFQYVHGCLLLGLELWRCIHQKCSPAVQLIPVPRVIHWDSKLRTDFITLLLSTGSTMRISLSSHTSHCAVGSRSALIVPVDHYGGL